MIERRFDVPFVADMALREKQIQQNYRPVIAVHKWFARRPGTLFRALLLSEFTDGDLRTEFFKSHDLSGITVCDPFMGGGTPLLEANRMGCGVLGTDINPMAFWVVREELEPIDLEVYKTASALLRSWLDRQLGHLYRTTCTECGSTEAIAKYFIWVKVRPCGECGQLVDLFPGYMLAADRRHPEIVLICPRCGELNGVADRSDPGECCFCSTMLSLSGPVRGGQCHCPMCGHPVRIAEASAGPPQHRLVAIEYVCFACRRHHAGRFFKKPDSDDHHRVAEADRMLVELAPQHIPDDEIPRGDETDRLHRWGYRRYREMFNARQLLGLELLCRGLLRHKDPRIRRALATNLSDLLRYQNMLCRYDTTALKSLDVFAVHGFPVGLMACESNILGVLDPDTNVCIGSGGLANITSKYARAKAYCAEPFEIRYDAKRKTVVPISSERIAANLGAHGQSGGRFARIEAVPAGRLRLTPLSLDAVMTDPPYIANVQYAELMDFCYVWLRRLMAAEDPVLALATTRHAEEIVGSMTREKGIAEFASGLSEAYRNAADALKPGAPFVFTFHHNALEGYYPVVIALLDSCLVCTASLPCPGEMGASIHINGTGSSIVDTVFVCRKQGFVRRSELPDQAADLAHLVARDVELLREAGMRPTKGDIRCIAYGHLSRWAVWRLRTAWDDMLGFDAKLARVTSLMSAGDAWPRLADKVAADSGSAPAHQKWTVHDAKESYGADDEISF